MEPVLWDVILTFTHHISLCDCWASKCVSESVWRRQTERLHVLIIVVFLHRRAGSWVAQLRTLIPLIVFCVSYIPSPFITLYQQLPWRLFFCSSLHSWCVWLVSAPNVTKYTHLHGRMQKCRRTQIVQRCQVCVGVWCVWGLFWMNV